MNTMFFQRDDCNSDDTSSVSSKCSASCVSESTDCSDDIRGCEHEEIAPPPLKACIGEMQSKICSNMEGYSGLDMFTPAKGTQKVVVGKASTMYLNNNVRYAFLEGNVGVVMLSPQSTSTVVSSASELTTYYGDVVTVINGTTNEVMVKSTSAKVTMDKLSPGETGVYILVGDQWRWVKAH